MDTLLELKSVTAVSVCVINDNLSYLKENSQKKYIVYKIITALLQKALQYFTQALNISYHKGDVLKYDVTVGKKQHLFYNHVGYIYSAHISKTLYYGVSDENKK